MVQPSQIKENRIKEKRDFVKLRSVLDIIKCRGQGCDGASNMPFEVVNLFLVTYHCFYLVIPGPPGARKLDR